MPKTEATPNASTLKLAAMGFLTLWCPYIFVWLIQKPEYPTAFRRALTAWTILWCGCLVLFFVVVFATGDHPYRLMLMPLSTCPIRLAENRSRQ